MDLLEQLPDFAHRLEWFRSRLGGYSLLTRMLGKGRATLADTNGEYQIGPGWMNTHVEIEKAFEEYQRGLMGEIATVAA